MITNEALWGYAFLVPWIVGFVCFIAGPMVASLGLSFTDYPLGGTPVWIGTQNYVMAFTHDELFWPAIRRTFEYAAIVVPVGIVGSLLSAILLDLRLKGTSFFRTFFYLPHLTPVIASVMIWLWLLSPQYGLVDNVLGKVGIPGPNWLGTSEWALPSLAIMALWGIIGGDQMIIFLAGLQDVPRELHEVAAIDGANGWQRLRHVTLPMLSPTIFFNTVLAIIGALQVFTTAFVATNGGPAYATWFYALHIYNNAFVYFKMGYASALSWIFFVVLIAFTYIQFRAATRWVYYAGEGR
jgi:multiple sugar transport system permease protein